MSKVISFLLLFGVIHFSKAQRPSNTGFQKQNLKGLIVDKETGLASRVISISLSNLKFPERIQGGITDIKKCF